MNYMFGECTNLTVLDLGTAFTNIPTQNEKMLNKCGTIGCIIYCGESIYSDINNMKLNTDSEILINYKIGTVNCKYKMTWSKLSSSFDVENKRLTIILKATGENTTYKETSSILKKDNISIYILSICKNDNIVSDKITWFKKNMPFLKQENIILLSKEDNKYQDISSKEIKSNYLKEHAKNDVNIVIDDDNSVIKYIRKNNEDLIVFQDSSLVD